MTTYTTGAFIERYQRKDGSWGWHVTGFENDTFKDGDLLHVTEIAETKEELIPEGGEHL